jgi:hypothetical protein
VLLLLWALANLVVTCVGLFLEKNCYFLPMLISTVNCSIEKKINDVTNLRQI